MAGHGVCPWWVGYLLASPLRRLQYDPAALLAPYVRTGMTVLEPGPGMGFFTLELARRVGPSGRVVLPWCMKCRAPAHSSPKLRTPSNRAPCSFWWNLRGTSISRISPVSLMPPHRPVPLSRIGQAFAAA
jgi:hypothetical protein